jgi:P27 family predicted phage terminase small subunit
MAGGRPKGAIVSQLKLPPTVRATRAGETATSTMHSKMSATRPAKPADLPDEISTMWDMLVDSLDEAGLLASVDGLAIELALRHYVAAVKASDDLLTGGSTTYDQKNERDMKNPASQVFRDHSTAFLEFAKQLGLSFVARARVNTDKGDADGDARNPFAIGQ